MDDHTFASFFDRFEESHMGWQRPDYETPAHLQSLRLQCQQREVAGRKSFGNAYLQRDNIAEAREEISDCVNYLHFEALKNELRGRDPEWDLVLEAAECMAEAYRHLAHLDARYRGAP